MPTFRLLHASDLHLAATPFRANLPLPVVGGLLARWIRAGRQLSHDPSLLRAFAQFALAHRRKFDALIVSGDLATTGEPGDLVAARDYLTAPPAGQTHLTSSGQPTLAYWQSLQRLDLLPGNHDRYRAGNPFCRPGGMEFDHVFRPPNGSLLPAGPTQGIDLGVTIPRGNVELHVVKADFCLRRGDAGRPFYGLPGWMGQGRVRAKVVASLVDHTRKLGRLSARRKKTGFPVWAIHFDPFSSDAVLQLLKSSALVQAARDAQVSVILCGHTHESKVKPLSERTTVYTCGTTTQAGSLQNDCQVLEIDVPDDGGTPVVRATWFRYDNAQGQFLALISVSR